jgi:hypothetical protein
MSTASHRIESDIRSAFSDLAYPGDEHLTVYNAEGRACDRSFQLLRGRRWEDLPVDEFMSGDTPIPDLTAESFCYYLPALLVASLGSDVLAVNTADAVQHYLSPESALVGGEFGFDDSARYDRKVALLTKRQRTVIGEVLREYVARGWFKVEKIDRILKRFEQSSGVDKST